MNGFLVYKLIGTFGKCPCCQSDKIGGGKGSVVVDTDLFQRECECGFNMVLTEQQALDLMKKAEDEGVNLYEVYCQK